MRLAKLLRKKDSIIRKGPIANHSFVALWTSLCHIDVHWFTCSFVFSVFPSFSCYFPLPFPFLFFLPPGQFQSMLAFFTKSTLMKHHCYTVQISKWGIAIRKGPIANLSFFAVSENQCPANTFLSFREFWRLLIYLLNFYLLVLNVGNFREWSTG